MYFTYIHNFSTIARVRMEGIWGDAKATDAAGSWLALQACIINKELRMMETLIYKIKSTLGPYLTLCICMKEGKVAYICVFAKVCDAWVRV
jgi:hypothetical protein